jgi:hypothetical protein
MAALNACRRRRTARNAGNAGAVYVEFLIAFMPFFMFFLCLWQLTILYNAKLMVDHAAFSAARAAAVVMAEQPDIVDPDVKEAPLPPINQWTESRGKLVDTSAQLALAPLIIDGTIYTVAEVQYLRAAGSNATTKQFDPMTHDLVQPTMMRVRVQATALCRIGLANAIMCPRNSDAGGRFAVTMQSDALFPYQGAQYSP